MERRGTHQENGVICGEKKKKSRYRRKLKQKSKVKKKNLGGVRALYLHLIEKRWPSTTIGGKAKILQPLDSKSSKGQDFRLSSLLQLQCGPSDFLVGPSDFKANKIKGIKRVEKLHRHDLLVTFPPPRFSACCSFGSAVSVTFFIFYLLFISTFFIFLNFRIQ